MRRDSSSPESDAAAGTDAAAPASRRDRVAAAVEDFQLGNDRDASFRFLYLTFFQRVQRFFARKGFGPEDCLDLTQETFLGIYRGLKGFRGDARFETWLFRVANTTFLKRLRSAATAKRAGHEVAHDDAGDDGSALESPASQLETLVDDERRRVMRAAIGRLPEQMRKCLTLRLYHQLKYREIADVLKLKIDTVKVHLFKARKRLKEELGDVAAGDLIR